MAGLYRDGTGPGQDKGTGDERGTQLANGPSVRLRSAWTRRYFSFATCSTVRAAIFPSVFACVVVTLLLAPPPFLTFLSHNIDALLSTMGLGSLVALALPSVSSATLLYATSYSGTLSTLNLTTSGTSGCTEAALELVTVSDGCAGKSSWLTLDSANGILYCLDEAFDKPNDTLVSFKTSKIGDLTPLGKIPTITGPVSAVIYGNNGSGLAVAEYGGSALQSYDIADPSNLEEVQTEVFKLDRPGTNPSRQEAPHPHQASLDPTGRFIVVPDLGADLVRVFTVDSQTLKWATSTPLAVAAGSGPRHVSWLATKSKTFFFLVSELDNTIASYEVTYAESSLSFRETYRSSTHGLGGTVPEGTSAAEVVVSPDQKFLLLSSRNESSIMIPNFDPSNSTEIPSDPIISFSIDQENGGLTWVQSFPAGGRIPRQFSVNQAGTLVAVGLQGDGRAVVINRDPATGLLKDFAASIPIAGEVTSVIFDE